MLDTIYFADNTKENVLTICQNEILNVRCHCFSQSTEQQRQSKKLDKKLGKTKEMKSKTHKLNDASQSRLS